MDKPIIRFYPPAHVEDHLLKYAVLGARYNEKWVLVRHKDRDTWENPGGHREKGESIEETARRELAEETGAVKAEICPIAAYSVTMNGETSYGMFFFGKIIEIGPLNPEMEIAEIMLRDVLPEELTYPEITTEQYHRAQRWLNMQCNGDELWDVLDENKNPTGRVQRRGDDMAPGEYHLVVQVWVKNGKGEFLITRRSPRKGYPNLWESTGGSALAGDDSRTTAVREVEEETGFILNPEGGRLVATIKRIMSFLDIWLFEKDFDLRDIRLQPEETTDACYASKEEIMRLYRAGEFVPYEWLEEILNKL